MQLTMQNFCAFNIKSVKNYFKKNSKIWQKSENTMLIEIGLALLYYLIFIFLNIKFMVVNPDLKSVFQTDSNPD
jgi:hypothetical protein